jgi:hypothetical protein
MNDKRVMAWGMVSDVAQALEHGPPGVTETLPPLESPHVPHGAKNKPTSLIKDVIATKRIGENATKVPTRSNRESFVNLGIPNFDATTPEPFI